jgi:hypothetical protein
MAGCKNKDEQKEEAASGDVFFDYRITGEDGNDSVTCFFQYRHGGPDGDAVIWPEKGKLVLDEEPLTADSAGLDGSYYEVRKPLNAFEGNHTILFHMDGKGYKEEFGFHAFGLATELPEVINRKPFTIELRGLPEKTSVRLVLVDTAFLSEDINGIYPVRNGQLSITTDMLSKLSDGPVSLQILWEDRRRLKSHTAAGGWITRAYSLSREFEIIP